MKTNGIGCNIAGSGKKQQVPFVDLFHSSDNYWMTENIHPHGADLHHATTQTCIIRMPTKRIAHNRKLLSEPEKQTKYGGTITQLHVTAK